MTPEAAKAAGALLVSKDQLFERADILTIHPSWTLDTMGSSRPQQQRSREPSSECIGKDQA
jgi:hypothetical protein